MFRKFRVMSRLMRLRKATLAALVLTGAAVALAIVFGGAKETAGAKAAEPDEGVPTVSITSPRNGEVQPNHAVVVKVRIKNFELAPASFGAEPELGEGNLHFALNRVPNCVDPAKLEKAVNSPTGIGRLKGQSMDFPEHAGPNGILAEELNVAGQYSPATQPEIFYSRLPPGFYRLIVDDRPEQRRHDALPRGHQLPDPAETRASLQKMCSGEGQQRQRGSLRIAQYFTLYSWW